MKRLLTVAACLALLALAAADAEAFGRRGRCGSGGCSGGGCGAGGCAVELCGPGACLGGCAPSFGAPVVWSSGWAAPAYAAAPPLLQGSALHASALPAAPDNALFAFDQRLNAYRQVGWIQPDGSLRGLAEPAALGGAAPAGNANPELQPGKGPRPR